MLAGGPTGLAPPYQSLRAPRLAGLYDGANRWAAQLGFPLACGFATADLADPGLWQDPAAALAPAREAASLARTSRGERVVLRYAETERLLADPRMRTVGARLLEGVGVTDGPLADWWRLV